MTGVATLFPGFEERRLAGQGVEIFARVGGSGPGLVLLHGYPQTHACWHNIAPVLAAHFTVIVPDLRGYGRSGCPTSDIEHRTYSKRTMAGDIVAVMRSLGFERFGVIGHDRGGRVAYRLALDRPDAVQALALIDIMTTYDQWQAEDTGTRLRMFHWPFLAQPSPLPESLISAAPRDWLEGCLKRSTQAKDLSAFHPIALADYHSFFADSDRRHATCEDYRAGSTVDLADDQADRRTGRTIDCPTVLYWGTDGSMSMLPDQLGLWRPWCPRIVGASIRSGHYVPEERPEELVACLLPVMRTAIH